MTRNVTDPVMYGPVQEVGGAPESLGGRYDYFWAKAESMVSVSTEDHEYYTETTTTSKYEGANKFDAAILTAQGTCDDCRVKVYQVKVCAYHSFLIYGMYESNWISISGGVHYRDK